MAKHLLTDVQIRKAKPTGRPYRLRDGDGLFLWVSPTGARSWQFRYRHAGAEQVATLGKADRVTLAQARTRADELRELVAKGVHLTQHKHAERATRRADGAVTFGMFAPAWATREARRAHWSEGYSEEVRASLRNHLGSLDRLPVSSISAAVVAPVLQAMEASAPHMVEKVRRRLRAILDDAVEQGLIPGNPLPTPRRRARRSETRHFPAITDPTRLGEVLRDARAADPAKGIQRAHLLLAFTAQRVGEVVPAAWTEFDLTSGTWSIPRGRMKRKDADRGPFHLVPIPPALLIELRAWHEVDGHTATYVCPAPRDAKRHVTAEGVEKYYRNALELAGEHSPHSWRSAFSTIARDHGKDSDVIEAQLDHVVGNKVAAAYDRALRLELRRELMRWYEERLVAARDGATVHAMPRKDAR